MTDSSKWMMEPAVCPDCGEKFHNLHKCPVILKSNKKEEVKQPEKFDPEL